MNSITSIAKKVVPSSIRQQLRTRHREIVFGKAMQSFLDDPAASLRSESTVLSELIYGWGNESWSSLDEYLRSCLEQTSTTPGASLECGSGLSTILAGIIAQRRGHLHLALEHTPEWGAKVQGYLDRYGVDSVTLCQKPLKDYGDYSWYDAPAELMPDGFTLVICDGPPSDTKGGRYGLVPVMKPWLRPGCVILLDDAGREDEKLVAKRWESELSAEYEFHGTEKPYIEMTVKALERSS